MDRRAQGHRPDRGPGRPRRGRGPARPRRGRPRPQARRTRRGARGRPRRDRGHHRRRAPGRAAGVRTRLLAGTDAAAGKVVAVVVLSDGAEVFLFRTTEALAAHAPSRPVAAQVAGGAPIAYGKFLAWRGHPPGRAAAPPGVRPHLVVRRGPVPRLEVRLRRLAGPQLRRGAPAARPRVDARRHGRRHGRDPHWRTRSAP
ncbi:hypothetical protein ACU686_04465 [Yinghuangia aomiensis]